MNTYYIEDENKLLTEFEIEFFSEKNKKNRLLKMSHSHPAVEFLYVEQGILTVDIDSYTIEASKGDFVFIRSNAVHFMDSYHSEPCSYYVLKILPSFILDVFKGPAQMKWFLFFLLKLPDIDCHIPSCKVNKNLYKIWEQMIEEYRRQDEYVYVSQRILAAEFLLNLVRTFSDALQNITLDSSITLHSIELVYRVILYVNEHLSNEITAAECSKKFNISYSYFAKNFHEITGKTFKEYVASCRLNRAKSMLRTLDLTITEIALACGYSNLSYFISEYKRFFGETPNDTKKNAIAVV